MSLVGAFNAQVAKARVGQGRVAAMANRSSGGGSWGGSSTPLTGGSGAGGGGGGSHTGAGSFTPALPTPVAPGHSRSTPSPWGLHHQGPSRRDIEAISSLIGTHYQPAFDEIDATVANLTHQQGAHQAYAQQQISALNRQFQAQQQLADLAGREANIQLGNIPEFLRLLNQQFGENLKAFAHNKKVLDKQRAFAHGARMLDMAATQRAREDLLRQVSQMRQDALSDAKVRGVVQAVRQPWERIDAAAESATKKIDESDSRSELGYRNALADLDDREKRAHFDLNSTKYSWEQQKLKLKEREQILRLEAERARISKEQARAAADEALARLNLQNTISQGQFMEALAKADAQRRALLFERWVTTQTFLQALRDQQTKTTKKFVTGDLTKFR